MALIAKLYVNKRYLGYVAAVRKDGEAGEVCEYRVQGSVLDHNGDSYEVHEQDDLRLSHHYDDGAAALMSKALDLFSRRSALSALSLMAEDESV